MEQLYINRFFSINYLISESLDGCFGQDHKAPAENEIATILGDNSSSVRERFIRLYMQVIIAKSRRSKDSLINDFPYCLIACFTQHKSLQIFSNISSLKNFVELDSRKKLKKNLTYFLTHFTNSLILQSLRSK